MDLEAALKNRRALRDRLRILLERASTVTEVLQVEKELVRLQSKIDSEEGKLALLKKDIALSDLDITFTRKRILGPLGYIGAGIWWVVSKLFVIQ